MKIIVPMAGLGSRFSTVGYPDPKPLINFLGKPMIQHVVEHLGLLELEHVFLCQKDHVTRYNLPEVFSFLRKYTIVEIDGLTSGAATTVSMAAGVVSPDDEVMIVNSDQLLDWDRNTEFEASGTIFCFLGTGPKWSYAKTDDHGTVIQVAEKVQISDQATAGMYHWKQFGDFLVAYKKMVEADDRTNDEFYVAPVYNYATGRIVTRSVNKVDQVGTPEELAEYLERTK
jgi:NDP-sugar pyrophosphorylase family protein